MNSQLKSLIFFAALTLMASTSRGQLGIRTAATDGPAAQSLTAEERKQLAQTFTEAASDREAFRDALEDANVPDERVELLSSQLNRGLSALDIERIVSEAVQAAQAPEECLGLFPATTLAKAKCFWQQDSISALRSARVVGMDERSTAAFEVVSGLMGPVRFDVSTSLTSGEPDTSDETAERRLQQLLTSGGNFSLRGMYPVFGEEFRYRMKGVKEKEKGPRYGAATAVAYARAGGVFDWLGEGLTEGERELDESNASFEIGADADMEFSTEKNEISFTFFGRIAAAHGTKLFHEAIQNTKRDPFLIFSFGAGVRLNRLVAVSVAWQDFALDEGIPSSGPIISLVLSPAPTEKETKP